MSSNFENEKPKRWAPIHPLEIVLKQELEDIKASNALLLEREIAAAQTIFRADVIQFLFGIDAFHDGIAWATFQGQSESDVLEEGEEWSAVIICRPSMSSKSLLGPGNLPCIRLIHQEPIDAEDGLELLTHDLMVDRDGDVFKVVSSFPLRESVDIDSTDISAPYFQVKDGRLGIKGNAIHPDMRIIAGTVEGREVFVAPFGAYDLDESKIATLDEMKAFFEKIKASKVQHINTQD